MIRNETDAQGYRVNVTTETFFRFCHQFEKDSLPFSGCEESNACVVRTFSNGTQLVDRYTALDVVAPSLFSHQVAFESKNACPSLRINRRIHIDFSCNLRRGLGKPIKLVSQPCVTTFNWPSIAVCNTVSKHPILSKCYIYDKDGEMRDLSALISPDAHVVHAPNSSVQYLINICSEVNTSCNTHTSSSSGTSVCVKSSNQKVEHLGDVRKSDMFYDPVSDEVVVKYLSSSQNTCPRGAFTTLIRLRCPPSRSEFSYYGLESRMPFLVHQSDCDLVVEWETDYACPIHSYERALTSNSCGIKVDDHFVDLKPLHRNESYLLSNVTNGNETLDIALNMCGGVGAKRSQLCGSSDWTSDAICLKSSADSSSLVFNSLDAKLTYADGNIYVSYPTRQKFTCPSPPETIIHFVCDETAGDREPTFSSFTDCILQLEWKTSRVCLPAHLNPPSCSLKTSSAEYDLSPLRRRSNESMWSVSLAGYRHHSSQARIGGQDKIFLNVCGRIPKTGMIGKVTSSTEKSSVYLYNAAANSSHSIGSFESAPVQHTVTGKPALVYQYVDNSENGVKNRITTTILFSCAVGNMESLPRLKNVTEKMSDGERHTDYTIEWLTGAACPLTVNNGTDCVVVDMNLGLKIDLNPLHEELHDIVIHGDDGVKYYMNICGKLKGDHCAGSDVGICRVDQSGHGTSLGQFTRNVTYWNGMLTLDYANGSTVQTSDSKVRRSSVLSLVC